MNPQENSDEQFQSTPKVYEPEKQDISIAEEVDQPQQNNINQTSVLESQQNPASNDASQAKPAKSKKSSNILVLIIIAAILVISGAIGYALFSSNSDSTNNNSEAQSQAPSETQNIQQNFVSETTEELKNEEDANSPNEELYQAVYLADGNIYFGKLTENVDGGGYTLANVFFLRGGEYVEGGSIQYVEGEDVSLAALNPETYATEKLILSNSEVAKWENMNESADIPVAIKSYEANF